MIDYNKINWCEYFELDETIPNGLKWKKTGKPAGTLLVVKGRQKGYQVKLDKVSYYNSRIIVVMSGIFLSPEMVVDHLDRNVNNNSINNLKVKSQRDNCVNKSKSRNNTSGNTGIRYEEVYNRFIAYWTDINKKLCSKKFSVNKYGYENAKILAIKYREQMIKQLQLEGIDYTLTHGK